MFSVTILTFPEAGMVIYMSIQYWVSLSSSSSNNRS
jgi:hypothetical protein